MSGIKSYGSIKGSISARSTLNGTISPAAMPAKGSYLEGYEPYGDEYEVTPDLHDAQVLNTAKKYLEEDIVVKKVPYLETQNSSDGITVYIGKEV